MTSSCGKRGGTTLNELTRLSDNDDSDATAAASAAAAAAADCLAPAPPVSC